ncbi:MAG: c-type cytochrome [Planctomycetes bacterium]|nr:c-type cytochrome [Planctomycetota bacterium]
MSRRPWLFLAAALPLVPAAAQDGKAIYELRCVWCHGEKGDGNGPSAEGMFPRPRDFTRGEYKIRSTGAGERPTAEDLFRTVSRGLPNTPMPGWEGILGESERRAVVEYVMTFDPRFASEEPETIATPTGAGSVERGKEVFARARCFTCHGREGRGDGGITTTLFYQWGLPFQARDLTRGWTFKGGHDPVEIYRRITGGLAGTPMGPYAEILSDEERWDLAHYVASLDEEPSETAQDFLVLAHRVEELPADLDGSTWDEARTTHVPLAGQIVLAPPSRWFIPTAGTVWVRALHDDRTIAFRIEWDDPTGPDFPGAPDSALIQFALARGGRPYFLLGDEDNPVLVWQWSASGETEEWRAAGPGTVEMAAPRFEAAGRWRDGRWQVEFRREMDGEPPFGTAEFVPVLFSTRDGANGETGDVRALSTWLYVTLEPPPSARPWLSGAAHGLGAVLVLAWLLRILRRPR